MLLRDVSRACGLRLAAALACGFRNSAKRSHRAVFEDKHPEWLEARERKFSSFKLKNPSGASLPGELVLFEYIAYDALTCIWGYI
jgi:hypothetical protein